MHEIEQQKSILLRAFLLRQLLCLADITSLLQRSLNKDKKDTEIEIKVERVQKQPYPTVLYGGYPFINFMSVLEWSLCGNFNLFIIDLLVIC